MRCETEVSRFGKHNNFRLTLVTDQYCAIQSNPLFWTYSPVLAESILILLFSAADQHYSWFNWDPDFFLECLSLQQNFYLWEQEDVQRAMLAFLAFHWGSFIQKVVFVSRHHGADRAQILAAVCFLFTSSLKMYHTYCAIGLMLYTSLMMQCLFSLCLDTLFPL